MLKLLKSFFLHPQSVIVGFGFTTLSLLMSTWAIRLPELKIQLGINDAQVGTALLILSIGSLIISPFSTYIMDRYPTGKVTFVSVIIQSAIYILPFLVQTYTAFLVAMFLVGLAMGFINITINASAAMVEKKYHRSIMSSCHGMFSIGAIIGSIGAGVISELGVSPLNHMIALIAFLIIGNFFLRKTWFSLPNSDLKAPAFAIPTLPVLGFFSIAFCIVLAEMTIMDWSAVYLKDTLKSSAALTGLGFAAFSTTMAIGRLSGDTIVPKIGKRKIITIGCILASLGLGLAAFTTMPWMAIFGFAITGIGMATIIPILYSLSANMENVNPGVGIASIATACISGGLIGRPIVGFVSNEMGMSVSMWIASGFALVAGGIAISIGRKKTTKA